MDRAARQPGDPPLPAGHSGVLEPAHAGPARRGIGSDAMSESRAAALPASMYRPISLPVLIVYAAALVHGLALVSFPALSAVLTRGYGLSDAEYGASFLPQVACAVLGALLGGGLARRLGLKSLLALSLLAAAASQALLASLALLPAGWAFACVLAGTAALGFGFGLSGAPLNSYPPTFFPRRSHTAVVAAHTVVGSGLAVGPLVVGGLVAGGAWFGYPLLLLAIAVVLAAATMLSRLPAGEAKVAQVAETRRERPVASPMFWAFVAIVVVYAFAEGTFSNWAVIFLRDGRGLPETTANWGLSAFWGALVFGRLAISALVARVSPALVWAALPLLMIAAFLLLPTATGAVSGIALFALAGLACSAFLPLSITLASHRFPHDVAFVSSMLVAALMVGVGIGSFAVGALREVLSFDTLYRLSVLYPVFVLLLALPVLRAARRPGAQH
ncbi:MAG TPA: MFS transporter [Rhodospirillales bacterium]|nr:MFS transporter [Rhodospirillales bacterium]